MEIYLLRHGIAEDGAPGMDDSERALTPEGKAKLRAVLKTAARDARPDLVVSSPYRRAVETAQIAAEVLGYAGEMLRSQALVPYASPREVWEEIRLHRDARQLLLAGHEPCLGRTVAFLLGAPEMQVDMKKAALVRVDVGSLGPEPRGVLKWMLTAKLAG